MERVESLSAPSSLPLRVRIGKIWFQNRGISPVPLFLLLVLLRPDFTLSAGAAVAVVAGILASEALRLWAVGFAGSATRTRGAAVSQLVHAGPYRFIRNPLYVANIAMYTLVGVLFGFSSLSAFIFIYSTVQYDFIVSFEESSLGETFGAEYEKYRASVPRWCPSKGAYPSSYHLFSLKKAVRSERSTLIAMLAMAALLVLKTSNLE